MDALVLDLVAWRPSRGALRFAKGGRGGFNVSVTINFASLGPRNYETEFLISEANQLLKIRNGFLFWFCCFVLVVQRAA